MGCLSNAIPLASKASGRFLSPVRRSHCAEIHPAQDTTPSVHSAIRLRIDGGWREGSGLPVISVSAASPFHVGDADPCIAFAVPFGGQARFRQTLDDDATNCFGTGVLAAH